MKETPDLYGAYPRLDEYQLAELTPLGERRTTSAGEVLQQAGDPPDEFIVVLDGTVAIVQQLGQQDLVVAVHGPHRFLGEIGTLTGQPLFLTAVAQEAGEVLAVPLDRLRDLVSRDPRLADLILRAFLIRRSLQLTLGAGFAIIGSRFSADTRRLREFAARNRLPHHWIDLETDAEAERLLRELGIERDETPVVIWRGEVLRNPDNERLAAAVGLRRSTPVQSVCDLIVVGAGPAGLAAAVYGASEGLATVVLESVATGGQAGTSSRIENYLGFPAGISGTELTSRAVTQARKFGARTATPYRASVLEPGGERHVVKLEEGNEVAARAVLLATGAEYRRLPVANLDRYEGLSVFYAAGPPEGHLCGGQRVGVIGGGNSAAQAAVWLARGGALVTLLHRRTSLSETMSHYLIAELDRYGVAVRDRSEVVELHGDDERLDAVTLTDGTRLPLSFLFLFLGATPCTDWLGDSVTRDSDGFVLTGLDAGADGLLETSVPGVYAAGDVRAGSIKRCATAVGEGATIVRFVHEHLSSAATSHR